MGNHGHTHEHPTGHTPEMHDRPDQWHRHTTAEEMPQAGHAEIANPGRVLAVGLISCVLVAASSVAVYFYYLATTSTLVAEREGEGLEKPILTTKRDLLERLDRGYVWINDEQGAILLPHSVASRNVINEYTSRLQSDPTD